MRKFYLATVMLLLAITVCAQEKNYYVQLTGGANYNVSEQIRKGTVGDAMSFGGTLTVGREFNPYWSGDIQASFNRNVFMYGKKYIKENYDEFSSYELFVNAAYDLTNGLCGVKADRTHRLYATAGVGALLGSGLGAKGDDSEVTYGVRVGLTYTYAFNSQWAAVTTVGGYLLGDNFNGINNGFPFDLRVNAEIGVRYCLGK